MKDLVFVSGVQKELAAERQAVCDFIRNDALLRKYFDVFLFEELLATDRRADKLYFDYVDRSAIYLGIFLIADPLFLAHYIEKAGTGTLAMIDGCREAGLPEPEFHEDGDQFVLTLWRDWLADAVMGELGLSERQIAGVMHVKAERRITNREYQRLAGVGDRTALRDLDELVAKGVLEKVGETDRATHYVLVRKPDSKPTNPTRQAAFDMAGKRGHAKGTFHIALRSQIVTTRWIAR